jgi:hypothetical protein
MQNKLVTFLILLAIAFVPLRTAAASSVADVTNDKVTLNFPNTLSFHADITSAAKITSVVLEYGTNEQTCGQVIAKAYPQITPGTSVSADWTWDMHQSGSQPPGSKIWWQWRYTDETGKETVSTQQTVTWLDNKHNWQTVSATNLNLHYYDLDAAKANDLLDAGKTSLARNLQQAGLKPDGPMDVYVYKTYQDLQDAVLYEPSWLGGEAFPDYNITIVGLSSSDAAYDRNVVIHELTHVLVGHLTFTCLGGVPQWLNEGLAVYSEGALDADSQKQLDQAVQNNSLLTVRSISGQFSAEYGKATLSYAESDSLVNFLIQTYGQPKMTALLLSLRDGNTIDESLTTVYGFNVDGLEDAWRKSLGAAPRTNTQPTAVPTATMVPTIVPVSGAPLAITPTPFNFPTPQGGSPTQTSTTSGPPLELTLILAAVCCVMLLLFGVMALGVMLAMQRRKGGSDAPKQ